MPTGRDRGRGGSQRGGLEAHSTRPFFLFATGIENSAPTINNGRTRVDELEKCGHYEQWRRDFDLVGELGIRFLRYGPPLHRTWRGRGQYDWRFADETLADLRRRGVVVITDLCHFGVPDWIGNFQNPDFPELFAEYAADVDVQPLGRAEGTPPPPQRGEGKRTPGPPAPAAPPDPKKPEPGEPTAPSNPD